MRWLSRDWQFPYFLLIAVVSVSEVSRGILEIHYDTFITEVSVIIVLFIKPDSRKNQLIGLLLLIVPKGKYFRAGYPIYGSNSRFTRLGLSIMGLSIKKSLILFS